MDNNILNDISTKTISHVNEDDLELFIEELVDNTRGCDSYTIQLNIDNIEIIIIQNSNKKQNGIEVSVLSKYTKEEIVNCLDYKCDSCEISLTALETYKSLTV